MAACFVIILTAFGAGNAMANHEPGVMVLLLAISIGVACITH